MIKAMVMKKCKFLTKTRLLNLIKLKQKFPLKKNLGKLTLTKATLYKTRKLSLLQKSWKLKMMRNFLRHMIFQTILSLIQTLKHKIKAEIKPNKIILLIYSKSIVPKKNSWSNRYNVKSWSKQSREKISENLVP